MKGVLSILKLFLFSVLIFSCSPGEDLTEYVDPIIGTAHCRWFFFTPAAVPFGMAKPSPTTDGHLGNPGGWQAVGYDYRHNSIEGFANFHEFQVGGIVVAPTTGTLQTLPGELDKPDSGYRSRFDRETEQAHPGYYSVYLKDYDVLAELTATERVAFHRYTFEKASDIENLIFNVGTKMGESGEVLDSHVEISENGHRIDGWVKTRPVYVNIYQKGSDLSMFFSADIDADPVAFGTFVGGQVKESSSEESGKGAGAYLQFDPSKTKTVNVKMGLSFTSMDNARLNLNAEADRMSFDKAKKLAHNAWAENLGRIKVEGGRYEDRVKFYTGLFHALLGRGLASDVNGAYPANDGSIGQIELKNGKPVHNHYNTDAIWGGYWNLTQLWSLAWPEYYSDWISSQLLVYKDAGWLGDGIANSHYVSGVGTNMVGLAIAAAYNCGIRDYDVNLAYEAARKNELESIDRPDGAGKLDVGLFVERGYSPYDQKYYMQNTVNGSGFASSHTLEYAFSCYAVAQMAKSLGKDSDYAKLSELSKGWKNQFDPELKLMRPRGFDGEFISDFDPFAPWIGFQEGNAVQYTYYVPHDIEELISMVGVDEFNNRLDSTFVISRDQIFGGGTTIDAFSGLHTYYNHGNQPNLHISSLFNFSQKPWLSQKWMRTICNEFYGTEGIHGYGYGQDEDQGQLGAWFVMASMGLFDAKGLTSENPSFQIGSPLFDKITIKLNPEYANSSSFVIETINNSDDNIYIDNMSLDGKALESVQLPYRSIIDGGTLRIVMSGTPNEKLIH